MKCYDLYGSKTLSPAELSELAGAVLGLHFTLHESSYKGAYYLAGDLRGEYFEIQLNQIFDEDGGFLEPDYEDFSSLISVNGTSRENDVRMLLGEIGNLTFLRRESP